MKRLTLLYQEKLLGRPVSLDQMNKNETPYLVVAILQLLGRPMSRDQMK
jgi:hypothetical protein